jgi:putative ABC transport system permease protein
MHIRYWTDYWKMCAGTDLPMLRNYIVIAWRSLLKNRLFSFINIFGLALSLSLCMMVTVDVVDTFRYDNFHPETERTYRILSKFTNKDGNSWTLASTSLPLLENFSSDSTLFENAVSLYPAVNANATDGIKDIFIRSAFTQPSFFEVFGFLLADGDPTTALTLPNSIVLSDVTARKFFGTENAVGKMITIGKFGSFMVTGVLREAPNKSHISFDAFLSFSTVPQLEKSKILPEKLASWNSVEDAYTYVVMGEGLSRHVLDQHLTRLSSELAKGSADGSAFALLSQPLSSITPASDSIYNDINRGPTWGKMLAGVGVAFIILLAACFNYTNLSIAQALTRTKEVGIRKIAGARRSQIFLQYVTESVVVALFALCAAQVIYSFILEYQPFSDVGLSSGSRHTWPVFACFIGIALATGIMAGALPAWILSSFRAAKMLRNITTEKVMGGLTLRKILVVFQFSISLVILIFLTVYYRQFSFMASAETGFRRDNILSIAFSGKDKDVIATEIARLNGVEQVGAMSGNFGKNVTGVVSVRREHDTGQLLNFNYYFADDGIIPLSGLRLVAGANFTDRNHSFETEVILNEKATGLLGFHLPSDAIGEKVLIEDSVGVLIVGVVADFYFQGVGNAIRPLALRNKSDMFTTLSVRVSEGAEARIIPQLEQVWKKTFGERALSYVWLDKEHAQRHDQTSSMSLLGFLAFMTITIASLGLLGLVVYTVETRRKEISIRKIIGASIHQLLVMLSKGFIKLLLVAGVIAIPTGYILSELFLMNFANRVTAGIWSLALCFILLLAIGLLMILSQTYKAATEDPARNLRSE